MKAQRLCLSLGKFFDNNHARWGQGELARDINGEPLQPDDRLATCFCINGALIRLANNRPLRNEARVLLAKAVREGAYKTLPRPVDDDLGVLLAFNDWPARTASEVIDVCLNAATYP